MSLSADDEMVKRKVHVSRHVPILAVEVYLQIGRKSHVDLLPAWSDTVEKQGVVHGAIPGGLDAVKGPEGVEQWFYLTLILAPFT